MKNKPSASGVAVPPVPEIVSKKPARNGQNHRQPPRTLGPVADLEQHVRPDWWNQIFNSLYLKTDADVIEDGSITSREVDLIIRILGIEPGDHILDLCCGQGRHTLELVTRGFFNVQGLDRSRYLIQKGRERARAGNLPVRFREGDARRLPYSPDSFDTVLIMGNSFGYFDTSVDDMAVLREIQRVLKPWGQLFIDVTDGEHVREHFEPRSWEWIDKKHFVCRERSLSRDGTRLVSREVITHVERGLLADQFYAERLYSPAQLQTMLEDASFSDVQVVHKQKSASKRNQDLGMMAHRIMMTARIRKEWTVVKAEEAKAWKHVVVVMGDPSKPDILKPGHRFDDDDFYTIDQLKAALKEIHGYRFTYLTSHDSLYNDLVQIRSKVDYVLNLCDEGFGNDARKELHVPSVLEWLQIPYSGAGPQCLAHCYDKSLVRGVAKEMAVPVAPGWQVQPGDTAVELPFDFPVIIKPNFGDSSVGITVRSVVNTAEELIDAVAEVRGVIGYERPLLIEKFLQGPDLTLGIIGNPGGTYRVLPITQEDYSILPDGLPHLAGYEAKWEPDSPYWKLRSIPADLPDETRSGIERWSLMMAERLECRDYVRLDWRLDNDGRPCLLEVNPNPGWCWDGHLAKMSAQAGLGYASMLGAILAAAEERLGVGLVKKRQGSARHGNNVP